MPPGYQPGHATMIGFSQFLAIGVALLGALAPPSFGQDSGRPLAGAAPVKSTAAAEKPVRDTVAAYVASYNQKDATKLAAFFTEDATLIDSENVATSGREAIIQD